VIQHGGLTAERWSRFSLEQQVLSIAAEMLRAQSSGAGGHGASVLLSYERVLAMVDLTVEVQRAPALRRELLRWRELLAERYVALEFDARRHAELLRVLLYFTPGSARQLAAMENAPPRAVEPRREGA
jgi:hypothetical protein